MEPISYVFIGVAILILVIAMYYLFKGKKADGSATIPPFVPSDWTPTEPITPDFSLKIYSYWGESNPSQFSAEEALANPMQVRKFYMSKPIARNRKLYHSELLNIPVDGKGQWIALTNTVTEEVIACKISDKGIITSLKKAL